MNTHNDSRAPARRLRLGTRLATAWACWLVFSCPAADPPPWLTVAVFDFESREETLRHLGPQIATLVNAHLSSDPGLVTVERVEVEKLLSEQELGLSGAVQPELKSKLGHWLGAQVLVTGRVFKAGTNLVVVSKIISTETSRVYGELATLERAEDLTALSEDLTRKIRRTLLEKRDSLVVQTKSDRDRIEALVRRLKPGERPTVSVTIPERHLGVPTTDPAVETELLHILQQAGFTVLDARATGSPQLSVTGEAFSAFGLRKGNLVACRARVEVRLHDTASGTLRLVDRQTSVALDLSEPIAAKAALQEAALTLAERLLPQLVP